MPLLRWKPEYTVNEPELDSHHKRLFDILNTAYESVMNSLDVHCIVAVVDELAEYVHYHFAAEEKLMLEKGYQGIEAHIAEHRQFSHTIETLKTNHPDNDLEAAKDLIILLGNWVLHHILIEDMKYSDLLGHEE